MARAWEIERIIKATSRERDVVFYFLKGVCIACRESGLESKEVLWAKRRF